MGLFDDIAVADTCTGIQRKSTPDGGCVPILLSSIPRSNLGHADWPDEKKSTYGEDMMIPDRYSQAFDPLTADTCSSFGTSTQDTAKGTEVAAK
jgi:hypothetical protein